MVEGMKWDKSSASNSIWKFQGSIIKWVSYLWVTKEKLCRNSWDFLFCLVTSGKSSGKEFSRVMIFIAINPKGKLNCFLDKTYKKFGEIFSHRFSEH